MFRDLALKAGLVLALVGGVALAGLGLYAQGLKAQRDSARLELTVAEAEVSRLTQEIEGLQALRALDASALARAQAERAAAAKRAAALKTRLDAALAANRAWADQPVPKEVQDALAQP